MNEPANQPPTISRINGYDGLPIGCELLENAGFELPPEVPSNAMYRLTVAWPETTDGRPGSWFPRVLDTRDGKPYAHEVYLLWYDGRLCKAHCADCREESLGDTAEALMDWAFTHRPDGGDARVIVDKPERGPFWGAE